MLKATVRSLIIATVIATPFISYASPAAPALPPQKGTKMSPAAPALPPQKGTKMSPAAPALPPQKGTK